MKYGIPVALLIGFAMTTPPAAQGGVILNFGSGSSLWETATVNNGGVVKRDSAFYSSTGGNPDGFIYGEVENNGNRLYGFQPSDASVFGDLTGTTLTVDTKITGLVTGPGDHPTVRFYIGSMTGGSNYFVSKDAFSWNINSDLNWVTHQVQMLAENFIEWPNQAAHSMNFTDMLSHVDDIGLVFTDTVGNFTNNHMLGFRSRYGATIRIDNFGTIGGSLVTPIPEPATFLLLLAGLVLFRKRATPH